MRGAAFTILHHPSTLRTYITIVFIKPQSKRSGIIHSLVTFVSCNYISNLVNSLSFIFARTHDSIPIVFIRPINEQWMKKIWSPSCSNKSEKMLSYTVFFSGPGYKKSPYCLIKSFRDHNISCQMSKLPTPWHSLQDNLGTLQFMQENWDRGETNRWKIYNFLATVPLIHLHRPWSSLSVWECTLSWLLQFAFNHWCQ